MLCPKRIETFNHLSKESYCLLLYSGVLLDFGQIINIEENYLETEQVRNNKRYYYAILEQEQTDKESFWNVW